MLPRPLHVLDNWKFLSSKGVPDFAGERCVLGGFRGVVLVGWISGLAEINLEGEDGLDLVVAARCRGSRAARRSIAPGAPLRSPFLVAVLLLDVHRPLFLT